MTTQAKPFSALAAALLAVVAGAHLLRVLFALEVTVDTFAVPISASVVATLVAGGLSWMVWRESRS